MAAALTLWSGAGGIITRIPGPPGGGALAASAQLFLEVLRANGMI